MDGATHLGGRGGRSQIETAQAAAVGSAQDAGRAAAVPGNVSGGVSNSIPGARRRLVDALRGAARLQMAVDPVLTILREDWAEDFVRLNDGGAAAQQTPKGEALAKRPAASAISLRACCSKPTPSPNGPAPHPSVRLPRSRLVRRISRPQSAARPKLDRSTPTRPPPRTESPAPTKKPSRKPSKLLLRLQSVSRQSRMRKFVFGTWNKLKPWRTCIGTKWTPRSTA